MKYGISIPASAIPTTTSPGPPPGPTNPVVNGSGNQVVNGGSGNPVVNNA